MPHLLAQLMLLARPIVAGALVLLAQRVQVEARMIQIGRPLLGFRMQRDLARFPFLGALFRLVQQPLPRRPRLLGLCPRFVALRLDLLELPPRLVQSPRCFLLPADRLLPRAARFLAFHVNLAARLFHGRAEATGVRRRLVQPRLERLLPAGRLLPLQHHLPLRLLGPALRLGHGAVETALLARQRGHLLLCGCQLLFEILLQRRPALQLIVGADDLLSLLGRLRRQRIDLALRLLRGVLAPEPQLLQGLPRGGQLRFQRIAARSHALQTRRQLGLPRGPGRSLARQLLARRFQRFLQLRDLLGKLGALGSAGLDLRRLLGRSRGKFIRLALAVRLQRRELSPLGRKGLIQQRRACLGLRE